MAAAKKPNPFAKKSAPSEKGESAAKELADAKALMAKGKKATTAKKK